MYIDIKIRGSTFQPTEIVANTSLKVSFDYYNEPCTIAIVKKKLARQVFVRYLGATALSK